ncbi:biotin-dependent carboxyltransferase family protein [Paludifilum halophilum]|uniref:5-oxoprolinase subunit C family protein n=1 Tax=Paludifilum halophilum TaxID=1642702 RepID=UPI001F0ADF6D|nr:biotin-dependent carboxyltransferase family protein [Paludifilum halophilum]
MTEAIRVLKPGLLTTVQDLGRTGYQQYGMPVSGAMDPWSLQVGNLLVGNSRSEAGLEITWAGPVLQFLTEQVIALTGGDLGASLDGSPVPLWKSLRVSPGQELRFKGALQGTRAYLTVAGGVRVPPVLGSKSTYLKGRIGGFQGRALQADDVLDTGDSDPLAYRVAGRQLSRDQQPVYKEHLQVRVVPGPEYEVFTPAGIATFFNSDYRITPQSDRMGYRLKGPNIPHRRSADILSDATAPGSIQVPAEGQPIVLMADRQTTGGYTKIATVISVDLPILAQAAPGHTLSFEAVDVNQAQKLAVEQEHFLRRLEAVSL